MTDATVLVTGGTGRLGGALVARLVGSGRDVRVLSRRPGPGRVVGDLDTGAGLDDAVRGATAVVHAATRAGHDVAATRRLLEAITAAGERPHLVYVSIVGIEGVPMSYYREKLQVEELITDSGLPWTIQRATQFHDLLAQVFGFGARLPVLPVLARTPFQPVDVDDVAVRLAELVAAGPTGRAPDLGGPLIAPMAEFADQWLAARGKRRVVAPVWLPGGIGRGFRSGVHTTPAHRDGTRTFAEFAGAR